MNFAVRKLLESQLSNEKLLVEHLSEQRKKLAGRAKQLSEVLQSKGWKVINPEGGLFLVASPERFIKENNLQPTNGGDLITEILFKEKNIVINNSTWTGLPGYCRFVLSCTENDFNRAIERLKDWGN